MSHGKKAVAEKHVLAAISEAATNCGVEQLDLVENVCLKLKINKKLSRMKLGGTVLNVPESVEDLPATQYALKLIRDCARELKKSEGTSIKNALYKILTESFENKGLAIKKRDEKLAKIAENKVHSHLKRSKNKEKA
jgi:ribosomal protein S7